MLAYGISNLIQYNLLNNFLYEKRDFIEKSYFQAYFDRQSFPATVSSSGAVSR